MNVSYSIAFYRWVVLRRGHKPGSLSHCAVKETKVQGDCSSELRIDPDETSSLVDEGYFFRVMVGRRRREDRSQVESPGAWESSSGFARQSTNGVPTVAGGHQAGQAG